METFARIVQRYTAIVQIQTANKKYDSLNMNITNSADLGLCRHVTGIAWQSPDQLIHSCNVHVVRAIRSICVGAV